MLAAQPIQNFKTLISFGLEIFLPGRQFQPINSDYKTVNPYAQFSVEGYMGMVMTSCLPTPPLGFPI